MTGGTSGGSTTRRTALAAALGMAWYLIVGGMAFWFFYSYYDAHDIDSETAFKIRFTLLFAALLASTIASSAFVAQLVRARVAVTAIVVAGVLALALLPSLSALALVNDCLGVSFPWDGGCPE